MELDSIAVLGEFLSKDTGNNMYYTCTSSVRILLSMYYFHDLLDKIFTIYSSLNFALLTHKTCIFYSYVRDKKIYL